MTCFGWNLHDGSAHSGADHMDLGVVGVIAVVVVGAAAYYSKVASGLVVHR